MFLLGVKKLYINGHAFAVEASRVHKNMLLLKLEGMDDINAAMLYKGKTVFFDREEVSLPEGRYFIHDIIGLAVEIADTGETLGRLSDVLVLPAGEVYVVKGEKEYMIPAVPSFVESIDTAGGL